MVNMMDYNIVVSEFELQLHYCGHFQTNILGKRVNPPIFSSYGIASLMFFFKDGFGIR